MELEVARACDEHVDSWLHRISKPLWQGDVAAVATLSPVDVFDAESMARQTREVIEEASAAGNCVIVGRGGQCVLRGRADAFHAFVYAPWESRVERIRERLRTEARVERVERLIREKDAERAAYVRMYFGRDWTDRELYDLMLNSRTGCEAAASLILRAMEAV